MHKYHQEGLDKERRIESRTGPVEYPGGQQPSTWVPLTAPNALPVGCSHLNMDATSIIRGISNENPALDLFRYIEKAWSLYERMGDVIRKIGAR